MRITSKDLDCTDTIRELLEALQIARSYIYLTHCQLVAACGHEDTAVRPDLDRIDQTIAKALRQEIGHA